MPAASPPTSSTSAVGRGPTGSRPRCGSSSPIPKVSAILVNIFGGITRGDEVARGLIDARAQQTRDVPMVVRIVGTNAAEAAELLEQAQFATATSLDDAAAKAVAASLGASV